MSITLEAEELRRAIAEAELPICDHIHQVCRARAEQEGSKQSDWEQICTITSLYPTFDLEEDPSPLTALDRLDAIPDDRLKEWAVFADAVGNADLIARCSDVYWLRRANQRRVREDVDRARTAIGAYIASATALGIDDQSTECFTRFQRALRLARTVNDVTQREAAKVAMIALVRARAAIEDRVGCLRLIGLLKSEDVDGADCAEWCNAAAASCAAHGAAKKDYTVFDLAAEYRRMRMFWLEKVGRADEIPDEWLAIAGYYASVSEIFEEAGATRPVFYATASHWMERSIEALRSSTASADEVAKAHRRLLALQRESVKAMKAIESSVNVTAMVKAAIASVEGKEYEPAFIGLLTCAPRPTADEIRELVARTPIMMRLIGNIRINQEGKQVAIREGVDANADAQWSAMVERMQSSQLLITEGAIRYARNTFNQAYPMRREELERMGAGSWFVPEGREKTWARGLYAGFVGDWMLVAHLLPPQIEHALRRLFEARGVIASGLHRSRQHEHDLNKLLSMKEAAAILGEDLQLDLAGSLAHGFGANVRNYVCHGLFDDEHYQSLEVIYVWWQALRLVLTPQLMFPMPEEEPAETATEKPDEGNANSPKPAPPSKVEESSGGSS